MKEVQREEMTAYQFSVIIMGGHIGKGEEFWDKREKILHIKDKVINGEIEVSALIRDKISESILIENCVFQEKVLFFNLTFLEEISIINCDFKKQLTFDKNTFKKSLGFEGIDSKIESLLLMKSTFEDDVYIHDVSSNYFWFNSVVFKDFITIDKCKVETFLLDYNIFENKLMIGNRDVNYPTHKFNWEDSLIKELYIEANDFHNLIFNNFIIEELNIKNFVQGDNLIFRNLKISKLFFEEFSSVAEIKFLRIFFDEQNSKFTIKDSLLKNLQFSDVDLSKTEVEISTSSVVDLITTNVTWSKEIKNNDKKSLRDVYRQLKYAMEKQGDKVQALEFQAKEMNTYFSSLGWGLRDLSERIILFFEKYSNNFGQNWFLPLLWFFLVGGLFYVLSCDSHTTIDYTRFLNPTRRISEKTVFYDLLWRPVAALFIYQIIIAFRKYSRKL